MMCRDGDEGDHVTVDKAGFRSMETFMSETDGQAWQEMPHQS
jgi:hypothetical protein